MSGVCQHPQPAVPGSTTLTMDEIRGGVGWNEDGPGKWRGSLLSPSPGNSGQGSDLIWDCGDRVSPSHNHSKGYPMLNPILVPTGLQSSVFCCKQMPTFPWTDHQEGQLTLEGISPVAERSA